MVQKFKEKDKIKTLLWSDRHCCLCGKNCGPDIEIHHINPNGGNDIENALPLCYDCHAKVLRYNLSHPRGSKYRFNELMKRRDQIYERYTRHLVPPTHYVVTQNKGNTNEKFELPQVGFNITNIGDYPPVKARIKIRIYLGTKDLGVIPKAKGYYSGKTLWHLNPRLRFYGNFSVFNECVHSDENLEAEVYVTIIDPYEREHELLPVCYRYVRNDNYWFLDPTEFDQLKNSFR